MRGSRPFTPGLIPLGKTVSLYFLCLFLLLAVSVLPAEPADTYQVVFEEVGQVATSVSYLHLAIDLHLIDLRRALDDYDVIIDSTFDAVTPLHFPREFTTFEKYWNPMMTNFSTEFMTMRNQFRTRHKQLVARLDHLTNILPHTAGNAPEDYQVDDVRFRRHSRTKRALPLVIIKGVVGTLMGLYNRHQTNKLRETLDNTVKEQKRLMVTVASHDKQLDMLKSSYSYLPVIVRETSLMEPMKVLIRLLEIEAMINKEVDRVTHAVQQAQHRRLAISVLSGDKLLKAFERIRLRTKELRLELLVEQPSDLFQIEVSYFFDGRDISLLLHVPMAAPNSLLRLHRFLPFPLSFTSTHFLLPRPDNSLFAISSGDKRLSLELKEADLEGCYHINSLHLCEKLGVLSSNIENSCLGALYNQNFERASDLCRLDVVPPAERVLQLGDNRYLIYALQTFTAPLKCRNFTASEHHFKAGINRVEVSPSCSLSLQEHVIFADSALRLDNQIREISWNPAELGMDPDELADAQESIQSAIEDQHDNPTLANLRQRSGHRRRWVGWTLFFVLLGLLIGVAVKLWILGFLSTRKIWLLKKSVKLIRSQVTAAVSRVVPERLGHSLRLPDLPASPRAARSRPLPALLPSTEYSDVDSAYAVEPAGPRHVGVSVTARAPGVRTPHPQRRHRHRATGNLLNRGRQLGRQLGRREVARLLAHLQPERSQESG